MLLKLNNTIFCLPSFYVERELNLIFKTTMSKREKMNMEKRYNEMKEKNRNSTLLHAYLEIDSV